jgi:RTX calcium-binding nonapeptide repeat (4 copies)
MANLLRRGIWLALLTTSGCSQENLGRVTAALLTSMDCPPGTMVQEGDAGPNHLMGTEFRDCLLGHGGDDIIEGLGGDDFLVGGDGNDTILGGNGKDQIFGETNMDTIFGGNGSDIIDGGDDDDIIDGNNGPDDISGGDGNDIINGGNGMDIINGGAGQDVILDSVGPDTIDGGDGEDACSGSACEWGAPTACDGATPCPGGQHCVGGACVYCHADTECDDGNACTTNDACLPTGGCSSDFWPSGYDTGIGCSVGVGPCTSNGTRVCDGFGASMCNAVPGVPGVDDSCDGIDNDCNGIVDDVTVDPDGDGLVGCADACPYFRNNTADPGDRVVGDVFCSSPDPAGASPFPMAYFPVVTPFGTATTDCTGHFVLVVPTTTALPAMPTSVNWYYESDVPGPVGSSTRLRVIDDIFNAWGTSFYHGGQGTTVDATLSTAPGGRRTLSLAPITISSSESELWRVGVNVIDDYQRVRQAGVQGGRIQYLRRGAVFGLSPYAFTPYDYVDLVSNILDLYPRRDLDREDVLYHESGHIIRDYADGDSVHFTGDVGTYFLARVHKGLEIYDRGYVFHEGWADFWASRRPGHHDRQTSYHRAIGTTLSNYPDCNAGPCGIPLTDDYVDWVELMVSDRLMEIADCVGVRPMLDTLEAHPGAIHGLKVFENFLFGSLGCYSSGDCCGLPRPSVGICPPGFREDDTACLGPNGYFFFKR